jgi:hypothetical protein
MAIKDIELDIGEGTLGLTNEDDEIANYHLEGEVSNPTILHAIFTLRLHGGGDVLVPLDGKVDRPTRPLMMTPLTDAETFPKEVIIRHKLPVQRPVPVLAKIAGFLARFLFSVEPTYGSFRYVRD